MMTGAFALAMYARVVSAHPGTRDRVPVSWGEASCIERFDRSTSGTKLELEYEVHRPSPNENDPSDGVTEDEVPSGRAHQFFAFCSDPRVPWPPTWVSASDVDEAIAHDLIPETSDIELLDENNEAFPCWVAITSVAERRPITFEAAELPIEWDVEHLAPGTYTPWGYTWDPPFNRWSQRYGTAIKIHDGNPDEAGPSVVITDREVVVPFGDTAEVEGCVDAADGTTLAIEVAEFRDVTADADELEWVTIANDIPVRGNTFSVELEMPDNTVFALVRVVATAPDGRSSHAFMESGIAMLSDPCEASFVEAAACDEPDDAPRPSSGDVEHEHGKSPTSQAENSDEAGCSVSSDHTAVAMSLPFVLVMLGALRPRPR